MTDPDQIRADIERTRANLSSDVNALTESVKPSNVAGRQVDKARSAVAGVKDKIMGVTDNATSTVSSTASGASSSVSEAASTVSDAVIGAPQAVKSQARGNPLAAGLIALGAGWLIGSMLPASGKEAQLAGVVKDNASTLTQPLTTPLKIPSRN